MDAEEFHKRASSNIKTIGADQEKKLKEFLVYPPLYRDRDDGRNCRRIFLDSMIKMRDSLRCVNILRNEKGIERIGIGIQVCGEGIVNWKNLLYGFAAECVYAGCAGVKEECLP